MGHSKFGRGRIRCAAPWAKTSATTSSPSSRPRAVAAARQHGPRRPQALRPCRRRGDAPARWTPCRCEGRIVIGEGERDEAPMLFIGEKVGRRKAATPRVDIAVDPLEGTNLCATGAPVVDLRARGGRGRAVSSTRPTATWTRSSSGRGRRERVHLDAPVGENLQRDRRGPRARDVADLSSSCSTARATSS